jgi:hypothetical protein
MKGSKLRNIPLEELTGKEQDPGVAKTPALENCSTSVSESEGIPSSHSQHRLPNPLKHAFWLVEVNLVTTASGCDVDRIGTEVIKARSRFVAGLAGRIRSGWIAGNDDYRKLPERRLLAWVRCLEFCQ